MGGQSKFLSEAWAAALREEVAAAIFAEEVPWT